MSYNVDARPFFQILHNLIRQDELDYDPVERVFGVLLSASVDEWGKSFPQGLTMAELEIVTRMSRREVAYGLAALELAFSNDPRYIHETVIDSSLKYSLRLKDEGSNG